MSIGAVVSFCTYDVRFLDRCLKSLRPFCKQIIVPVCDHFYNGTKEDLLLLQKIYQTYPEVDFIQFAYSLEQMYGTCAKLVPNSPYWSLHWHNTARLIGYYFLKPSIERVVFLDVDEIFSHNIMDLELSQYEAVRFASYWYFRTATKCATVYPDGPLLIRKDILKKEFLMNPHERRGMFINTQGNKVCEFLVDERPIVHHYSWVRSSEELLQKVRCWGHNWERDWEKLLQEKEDFVRNYTYRESPLFWDPLEEHPIFVEEKSEGKNVTKVTSQDIFRLETLQMLQE